MATRQLTYRFGIIAIDKTIDEKYPKTVLWLFENNDERMRWIKLISDKEDYGNIQLVEFDRQIVVD